MNKNTPHETTRRAMIFGLIAMLGSAACASGSSGAAAYGTKVRFSKGTALTFPDFELTYQGRRHVATPRFPRGFNYEDFTVSRGGKSITVSWSSGTGDIGPQLFDFDGHHFTLELRHADRFKGWLKEDELVIEKK